MASLGTLVQRVRSYLQDEPDEDYLIAAVSTASTTDVSVAQPHKWREHDVLEFDDGEQSKVRNSEANPLKVQRGHNDTTATIHASAGVVLRNPGYPYHQISGAISRTLSGRIWPYGYAVRESLITPVANQTRYAAPAGFIQIVSAEQQTTATDPTFVHYGSRRSALPLRVERGVPVSGVGAIRLYFPRLDNTTNQILLTYKAYPTISDVTDGTFEDVVVYGALADILAAKEIQPVYTQDSQGVSIKRPSHQNAAWFEARFLESRALLRSQLNLTSPSAREWSR